MNVICGKTIHISRKAIAIDGKRSGELPPPRERRVNFCDTGPRRLLHKSRAYLEGRALLGAEVGNCMSRSNQSRRFVFFLQ